MSGSGESGNEENQAASTTSTATSLTAPAAGTMRLHATATMSLLDKLKASNPSSLSRKWKIAVNLPCGKC